MLLLAINKDLYNKIIVTGQNFHCNKTPEVVFNLYELRKLHKIKIEKTIPTKKKTLNRLLFSYILVEILNKLERCPQIFPYQARQTYFLRIFN